MRFAIAVMTVLLVPLGCERSSSSIGLSELMEVSFTEVGSGGLISVAATLPPGMDAQAVADAALRYLRSNPSQLDYVVPPWARLDPMNPRGRDSWAYVVADIKGIDFLLPMRESEERRDKRIADLIAEIDRLGTSRK